MANKAEESMQQIKETMAGIQAKAAMAGLQYGKPAEALIKAYIDTAGFIGVLSAGLGDTPRDRASMLEAITRDFSATMLSRIAESSGLSEAAVIAVGKEAEKAIKSMDELTERLHAIFSQGGG